MASHVWKFYRIWEEDNSIAICNTCNTKVSRGGKKASSFNTTNLISHLKSQHRNDNVLKEYEAAVQSTGAIKKRIHHSENKDILEVKRNQSRKRAYDNNRALDLFYRFISEERIPSEIVDSPSFRVFLKYLNPHFEVPSRHSYLMNMEQAQREQQFSAFNYLPFTKDNDAEELDEIQASDLSRLMGEEHKGSCHLSSHLRCAAHSLNLLATIDVDNIPEWSIGSDPIFTKVKAKAEALWNMQNTNPILSATIEIKIGHKLKTPNITRWSSFYASMQDLNETMRTKMVQVNMVCIEYKLPHFDRDDKLILEEYITIMTPVKTSLEKLQYEDAYTGVLLPTLFVLREKLRDLKTREFKYAEPLVSYLLENPHSEIDNPMGFEARFSSLFDEIDLLVASAIHPYFKLPVVCYLNPDQFDGVRTRLLNEIKRIINATSVIGEEEEEEDGEDDFFKELRSCTYLSSKLEKELDVWCSEKEKHSILLDQNMFPALYRTAWVDVFLKYNAVISSSVVARRRNAVSRGCSTMKLKSSENPVVMKGDSDPLKIELAEEPERRCNVKCEL